MRQFAQRSTPSSADTLWNPITTKPKLPAVSRPLAISEPHDASEQEADAIAERVVSWQGEELRGAAMNRTHGIQRKCTSCEGEEEEKIYRKADHSSAASYSAIAPQVDRAVGSGGTPLDSKTRAFFEPRFGFDFSGVRVHSGGSANTSARALGALAYTVRNDIVFADGQFAPGTGDGRRVLAHELAHVVQQSARGARIQRLGANPGCTPAQRREIHQAIFNARGWLNKAIPALTATPPSATAVSSLRHNFGPTYGVALNIPLIAGRLRAAYRGLSTFPIGCADATEATCATLPCGWAHSGSRSATVCTNVWSGTADFIYRAGCVLHECLHASFSGFTVDEYSGWHGHSGSTPTYPGAGTDPLLNADSYTSLVMDLS